MEEEPKPLSSTPNDEAVPASYEGMPFPLDDDFLKAVHARVVERAPALESIIPEIRAKPPNIVLIYRVATALPDGHTLTRATRVTVNPEGKILKLSTSRG
mgnify:CR=1 FL=1